MNALTETITENRGEFSSGEIVLGIKFSGGAAGFTSIPAIDGRSEYGSLVDARKAESAAFSARIRSGETDLRPDSSGPDAGMQDWANKWFNEFGWEHPTYDA
ncbi:MAG TPA: hypothetical protein VGO22_01590 [Pseudorhizobium sp.]|nr:hypothetical protein [Pseudorhizobium sp.]